MFHAVEMWAIRHFHNIHCIRLVHLPLQSVRIRPADVSVPVRVVLLIDQTTANQKEVDKHCVSEHSKAQDPSFHVFDLCCHFTA